MGNKWLDNLHEEISEGNDAEAWQILNAHAMKWFMFGFIIGALIFGFVGLFN